MYRHEDTVTVQLMMIVSRISFLKLYIRKKVPRREYSVRPVCVVAGRQDYVQNGMTKELLRLFVSGTVPAGIKHF